MSKDALEGADAAWAPAVPQVTSRPASSSIDLGLIQAYMETEFHVHGDPAALLRVGEVSSVLSTLHARHHAACSAFVTACNPYSQELDDQANAQRQTLLGQQLRRQGLNFLEGRGQHPSNQWPAEPSYLVFGISLEQAMLLGQQLEQNAILWNDSDAVPQLILLR